jgi:hypothetical protein
MVQQEKDFMPQVQKFLDASYKVFNLNEDGRGKQNKHYIRVPAVVGNRGLPQTGVDSDDARLNNPFIFLTGKMVSGEPVYSGQSWAAESSVTFILGQYGLGKTELVHQVCQYLLSNQQGGRMAPLPVNLALCRSEVKRLRQEMPIEDFSLVLFSRILNEAGLKQSFINELSQELRNGRILLLLDGVDEFLSSPVENHYFLSNLSRLLTVGMSPSSTQPKFRAAVSMRLEYLASVASQDASELTTILNATAPPSVPLYTYFLKLDFLDDSRVAAYFKSRLTKGLDAFGKVSKNKQLMDMLRRPLLLRIFCDLAKLRGSKQLHLLLDSLKGNEHPSHLLKIFVDWAQKDVRIAKDQKKITSLTWDADKLAHKSVKLYEEGRSEMSLEDVAEILKDSDPNADEIHAERLGATEILDGIHKCPFLWKDVRNEDGTQNVVVHFGHKIFLEYFVAKGIFLFKERGDYTPWMNLVLNVDMRKFLKGMIDDTEWYERTKKSYALESGDLKSWIHRDQIDFKELEQERRLFLDYMTEPEDEKYMRDSDGILANAVSRFLDQEEILHPRYRLYTYEAVALYIWFHRWDERARLISARFSDVLEKRLKDIQQALAQEEAAARDPLELLVERILHIGQRLRYRWVKDCVPKKDDFLMLVKEPSVNSRLAVIFNNIETMIL